MKKVYLKDIIHVLVIMNIAMYYNIKEFLDIK